jgi:hypothetical protein
MHTRFAGITSITSITGTPEVCAQARLVRPAAEQILAACRRYIAAEIHRRNAPTTGRLIARVRAAEVATQLDALLTVHVFRRGHKRGVRTGAEAAAIKALARAIADHWDEPHPDPAHSPRQGFQNLAQTVYEVLIRRHVEDTATDTPATTPSDPLAAETAPLFAA